ncbi:MAG: hypothetical protein KatS3mg108_1725 [Isosphaeraceae bacterium]|jgi:hypothetical protein|nr:MAG: hypothetical protein KatS3mg108_1725 [Isosphaeraceae bacterium]
MQLCPVCGDPTHARGYCRVCEAYCDAPSGSLCSKHEIELEPAEPEPIVLPPRSWGDWITVARFPYVSLAIAPRLRLEAEGIPTFLDGERVAAEVAYTLATGGVRLQVPRSMADRARALLGAGAEAAIERPAGRGHWRIATATLAVLLALVAAVVIWLLGTV